MRGVVYCATGEDYVSEAKISARSLKEHNPSLSITMFTDGAREPDIFDEVRKISSSGNGFLDFIRAMERTPYDETLFLDSDTYITDNLSDIFASLERFDFVISQIPGHITSGKGDFAPDVPDSFPQYNTGVIAYTSNDAVIELLSEWQSVFEDALEDGFAGHDQGFLSELLWHKDVRYLTLPPEYNCRFVFPGSVSGKVKILHGRHHNLPAMANRLNSERGMRVFTGSYHRRIIAGPRPTVTLSYPGSRLGFVIGRLREIYNQEGMSGVIEVLSDRWRRGIPFC